MAVFFIPLSEGDWLVYNRNNVGTDYSYVAFSHLCGHGNYGFTVVIGGGSANIFNTVGANADAGIVYGFAGFIANVNGYSYAISIANSS